MRKFWRWTCKKKLRKFQYCEKFSPIQTGNATYSPASMVSGETAMSKGPRQFPRFDTHHMGIQNIQLCAIFYPSQKLSFSIISFLLNAVFKAYSYFVD